MILLRSTTHLWHLRFPKPPPPFFTFALMPLHICTFLHPLKLSSLPLAQERAPLLFWVAPLPLTWARQSSPAISSRSFCTSLSLPSFWLLHLPTRAHGCHFSRICSTKALNPFFTLTCTPWRFAYDDYPSSLDLSILLRACPIAFFSSFRSSWRTISFLSSTVRTLLLYRTM